MQTIVLKARPTIVGKAWPTIVGKARPTIVGKAWPTIVGKARPTIAFFNMFISLENTFNRFFFKVEGPMTWESPGPMPLNLCFLEFDRSFDH